ncbi:MAG: tRNA preQ1(34) S-adenosylmethionine ribosyltransferase-isomerase QueA [Deltaproteobacteria bacterium]|jgi:S-adenosylmethionine:tRNA ribosyltransferase-isomerase|nr:tRNA preQ1(34) S-adenosylmethionine ribosyltransferase-isomerase QueA [Deltaproteobacteria bacterium]
MFSLNDYDYDLPEERIAQRPVTGRDRSKLLFMDRNTGEIAHHKFSDIYDLLFSSDVLVINNTEVIPARLFGQKETGGKAEVFILDYPGNEKHRISKGECVCRCLIKTSKRPKNGTTIIFNQELKAEVVNFKAGIYTVKFSYKNGFEHIIDRIGRVPLPPYIKRNDDKKDRTFYQTVYASKKGAVAAPTAGLHFSISLMKKLEEKGVKIVAITLHVGYGTFLPVRVPDIRDHRIHSEWYSISKETADMINESKKKGHRIVAVGTTSVRTLEYASKRNGIVVQGEGRCNLFIYPGYRFKTVDAMITNFHLPKSTLLMLVSAFSTRENVLNAYKAAIEKPYRFFSYGDAMLIA